MILKDPSIWPCRPYFHVGSTMVLFSARRIADALNRMAGFLAKNYTYDLQYKSYIPLSYRAFFFYLYTRRPLMNESKGKQI